MLARTSLFGNTRIRVAPQDGACKHTPYAPRACKHAPYALLLLLSLSLLGCGAKLTVSEAAKDWSLDEAAAPPLAAAADWPMFRGVNGAGIGEGTPPTDFGPKSIRWKIDVPGQGYSSPVVWQDRVFLTTAIGGGSEPELTVLCYKLDDGSLAWQAPAGKATGPTHAKNGYASPSVVTDGRRMFAFFGSAGLFCYDIDGRRQWHVEMPDLEHKWGFGGSPVLFEDMVIVVCDGESDAFVAAYDQATGQQRWRTERPSQGCWSTPVFVSAEVDGATRTEMVVNGTTHESNGDGLVIAYDPRDGAELWRVRGTETFVTPTPLVCQDLVYSLSGRNGAIIAIRPGGTDDVTDTRVVWSSNRGGPYIPSGIAYRNRLFVLGDAGNLACYNAGNGQTIWRSRIRGTFTSSLVAAGGRIYAINEAGAIYVFAAEDEYSELGRGDLEETCYATPAIVDGDLLVRTESKLYRFAGQRRPKDDMPAAMADGPTPLDPTDSRPSSPGAEEPSPKRPTGTAPRPMPIDQNWPLARRNAEATGATNDILPKRLERLWTFTDKDGGFESNAAIDADTVYVGNTSGTFRAIDLSNGRELWKFDAEAPITSAAALRNGQVYFGNVDGVFFCLQAKTGRELWRFVADSEIDGGANLHNDRVLFGSQDSFLYCLDADAGQLVWKFESGDQIRCFPTIVEDRVLVAGCDGKLYVIRLRDGVAEGDVNLRDPTGSTPAVLGDRVFVGTEGGEFFAIDWRKKQVAWRYENPKQSAAFRSSAAVTPQYVVVGSRDKRVHAFDPKTGDERWQFAARGRVDSSPIIVGDRVFVGCSKGLLYELDLATGKETWRFEAGGHIEASPAVAHGCLVVGSDSGDLFCFGLQKPSAK